MKKFKVLRILGNKYVISKRNFWYRYGKFIGSGIGFYDSEDECITEIHKKYYPDECDIKVIDYTKYNC